MSKKARKQPDWLQGFRAKLAHGDRDASIWGAVVSGVPRAQLADGTGITRSRVGQIFKAINATLAAWPDTPDWLQSMPERQRELCLLHKLFEPDMVAGAAFRTAFEPLLDRWTHQDAAVVREYLLTSAYVVRMRGWELKTMLRSVSAGLDGLAEQVRTIRTMLDGLMEATKGDADASR